jgi:hypothetical protein
MELISRETVYSALRMMAKRTDFTHRPTPHYGVGEREARAARAAA